MPRHLPRFLPRSLPRHTLLPRAIHAGAFGPFAHRSPLLEPLLRTCQLILIIGLAVLGAQWAAKGLVRAGVALATLLH